MTSAASGRALRRALVLAAAVALGAPLASVPAYAAVESTTTTAAGGADAAPPVPSPAAPAAPAAGGSEVPSPATHTVAGVPGDGLPEAVLRDLGMTLEEFNAAGERANARLPPWSHSARFPALKRSESTTPRWWLREPDLPWPRL